MKRDNDQGACLKKTFVNAEWALIAGLNGLGRSEADKAELLRLRRERQQALANCQSAGVAVETLWDAVERYRADARQELEVFAEQAKQGPRGLPRRYRKGAAVVFGFAVVAVVLSARGGTPSILAVIAAAVLGLIAWAAAEDYLSLLFPTPGIRVGKLAADLETSPLDIWPDDSDDGLDAAHAFRWESVRNRRAGRGRWLRAR